MTKPTFIQYVCAALENPGWHWFLGNSDESRVPHALGAFVCGEHLPEINKCRIDKGLEPLAVYPDSYPQRTPPLDPESWTTEQIAKSVARIEGRVRASLAAMRRPEPEKLTTFLCLGCDQGASTPGLTGQLILGLGCPDCDQPESLGWLLFLETVTGITLEKGGDVA